MQPLTKRQREILDYLSEFIEHHGYAPSLEEIGRRLGLSSLATVHKHLTNLQEKGFIRRVWNRSRSVELIPTTPGTRALEIPLVGSITVGESIKELSSEETVSVPADLIGLHHTFALRARGNSMIDDHICDGDIVVIEDRKTANTGDLLIAELKESRITLRTFYRENMRIRLQSANSTMDPIFVDADFVHIKGVVTGILRKY